MKKFLGILAIAGTLVACNDSSTSTDGADTTVNKDTTTVINTPSNDTLTVLPGDTATKVGDTTKP